MTLRASRLAALAIAALTAGLLAGCSISTTTTDPVPSTEPVAPASPAPVLDLQLRQVQSAADAVPGDCPTLPSVTPSAATTASVCSNDGRVVYQLAPAAVTGERVTSIEAAMSSGGPIVQIKLDAMGGAALRSTTLRGSLEDPQPRLAIVTQGGVLAAPTMTDELDGGVLLVTGFESLEKADEVVAYISAVDS